MVVMAATATAIAAGTTNNQLKVVVEKTAVMAVGVAMVVATAMGTATAARTIMTTTMMATTTAAVEAVAAALAPMASKRRIDSCWSVILIP